MQFNQGRLILILELFIALYMLTSLAITEYKNYNIEKYIAQFELSNQELSLENDKLQTQFDYFTSKQYQEKIAKQNFGLAKPGEKVLVVMEDDLISDSEKFKQELTAQKIDFYVSLPNFQKWFYFYFK